MENTVGTETWREGWGCIESTAAEYGAVLDDAVAEAYPRPAIRRLCGDDLLSRVVSALVQSARNEDECHADVDLFYAPSECHGDVAKGFESDRHKVIEDFGFESVDEVWQLLAGRTTARFAYEALCGLRA